MNVPDSPATKGKLVRRSFIRAVTAAAMALVATGAVLIGAPTAANAATIGALTINPATGNDQSSIALNTSALCTGGTNLQATLNGGGFANINVTANVSQSSVSNGTGYTINLVDTMRGFAQANSITTLGGKYDFTLTCKNAFGATTFGDFTGSIWFTSNTLYQNADPATSTTVSASPASPQTAGTSVTFTATIVSNLAAGAVQFKDGAANLGSPVTVSGGSAALTTSALNAATHSVSAIFTPGTQPAGYSFTGSTAPAISYVVNAAPAQGTTTTLSAPATAAALTPVTFTTSVTYGPGTDVPSGNGDVQFKEGATVLSTKPLTGSTVTFTTSSLSQGSHTVTAFFVSTSPGTYADSASAPVSVTISAPLVANASETIETTVDPGSLTISVADNTNVVLPTPQLDPTGALLTTSGDIHPVTVTDTRAGNPGFTVNGQVTDFNTNPASSASINGYNLGWTPSVVDKAIAQTVTAGPVVLPADGLAPGATPSNPALGLKTARLMATGSGLGTTHLTATLVLHAPTSTLPRTYFATLTMTAI
jgi:hypothetical protein